MALIDHFLVGTNADFYHRVEGVMLAKAMSVLSEASHDGSWTARAQLAYQMLLEPEVWGQRTARAIVHVAFIAATIDGAATPKDSELISAMDDTFFNLLAGVGLK